MPRPPQRCWRSAPNPSVPSTCPTAESRGGTGAPAIVRGTPGRSLFVRLAPPGIPGKFTDAATGEHGDLLDLIRLATGAHSLREALAEARRFLAQPVAPASSGPDTYDRAQAARNLWDRCRPIHGTHAEAYLVARGHSPLPVPGTAVPSRLTLPPRCRRLAAPAGAGRRRHRR